MKGYAENHGGRKSSLTVPSATAQKNLLIEAWGNAGVKPDDISFIEAHGTGTNLGDPIEIKAILDAFGTGQNKTNCYLSSVKSNIGHLEAAAGIAGFIKTLLVLKNKKILPLSNFEKINNNVKLKDKSLKITDKVIDWDFSKRRIAGVSSFGFGGVNAHIIVEEYKKDKTKTDINSHNSKLFYILPFSAKTEKSLMGVLKKYNNFVENSDYSLDEISNVLKYGRETFKYRILFLAKTKDQLRDNFKNIISGKIPFKVVNCTKIKEIENIKIYEDWISTGELFWDNKRPEYIKK